MVAIALMDRRNTSGSSLSLDFSEDKAANVRDAASSPITGPGPASALKSPAAADILRLPTAVAVDADQQSPSPAGAFAPGLLSRRGAPLPEALEAVNSSPARPELQEVEDLRRRLRDEEEKGHVWSNLSHVIHELGRIEDYETRLLQQRALLQAKDSALVAVCRRAEAAEAQVQELVAALERLVPTPSHQQSPGHSPSRKTIVRLQLQLQQMEARNQHLMETNADLTAHNAALQEELGRVSSLVSLRSASGPQASTPSPAATGSSASRTTPQSAQSTSTATTPSSCRRGIEFAPLPQSLSLPKGQRGTRRPSLTESLTALVHNSKER